MILAREMVMKLTPAQKLLLRDLSVADETVSMPYKPAEKLIALGYATSRDCAFGAEIISITEAGRRALTTKEGSTDGH
jgi:hypothetical protein